MYFNVDAFDEDYVTIFRDTMTYLPRIGEEIVARNCVYTVTNVRYLLREGKNLISDVQLYLKSKI